MHNGCVPDEARNNPRVFMRWLHSKARQALEAGAPLSHTDHLDVIDVARKHGISIGRIERGGQRSGLFVGKWHIHIGEEHVLCPPHFSP